MVFPAQERHESFLGSFCPFFLTLKKLALGFWSRENRWKCRRSVNWCLTLGTSYCGKTNLPRLERESLPFPYEMLGTSGGE